MVSSEDRQLLEEHATFVREMEQELQDSRSRDVGHAVPKLEPGVKHEAANIPKISKMQIDLMVNSFAADFARVATLQFTNSVGDARMRWLGVTEGHHELSHNPDSDKKSQEKLIKINKWYCEQMAYLVKRLAETPEPGGGGSLLDNTLVIWTNELGKGNSHTLERHSLRARRQRPGFPDGPLDQVQARAPQPAVAGLGQRHGPSYRTVRQPRPVQRRGFDRIELRRVSPPSSISACPHNHRCRSPEDAKRSQPRRSGWPGSSRVFLPLAVAAGLRGITSNKWRTPDLLQGVV